MKPDRELDIVEELRFFAEAAETKGIVLTMLSGETFNEAADEIERLRENQNYRADFHDLTHQAPENRENPFDRSEFLVKQLRERACPAGEPWTGDNPEEDHGHTDCWLMHQAALHIEMCESELSYIHDCFAIETTEAYAQIDRMLKLITEWADLEEARLHDAGIDPSLIKWPPRYEALRKVIGR